MTKGAVTSGGDVAELSSFHGYASGQAVQGDSWTDSGRAANYGYWFYSEERFICIEVISDTIWHVRDSLDNDTIPARFTVNMLEDDFFVINNCGNCVIDLGLRYINSEPEGLVTGYASGTDRAVIYCRFRNDIFPPTSYDALRDWVSNIVGWASASNFGPSGFNFGSGDNMNLWMQFVSPENVSFGDRSINEFILTIEISSRVYLP